MVQSGGRDHLGKARAHKMFRSGFIANATISIVWTLAIIIPFEPFTILLRVIVGGGPGVWFLSAYLLHIAIGVGGFIGLSFAYYIVEERSEIEINDKIVVSGFYILFLGVNVTLVTLAVAGAIGGYYLNIMHAPVEDVRRVLEPMVNPLRLLCFITIAGALICLIPVYKMLRHM